MQLQAVGEGGHHAGAERDSTTSWALAKRDRMRRYSTWQMELVVLLGILALLILGPRRGGRMPGPFAMILGGLLLVWLLIAFGLGSLWNALTR